MMAQLKYLEYDGTNKYLEYLRLGTFLLFISNIS